MSDKTIEELIEASSFGTPEAKAARESVPHSTGAAIALAAKYLGRAEAAERKVAAVLALADEWERSARYLDHPRGTLRARADQNYADAQALRAALSSADTRAVTATEPGCTCGGMAACQQCQDRDASVAEGEDES